jgi:hypothetical protein
MLKDNLFLNRNKREEVRGNSKFYFKQATLIYPMVTTCGLALKPRHLPIYRYFLS